MEHNDTSWGMKWMRTVRKRAINILARIENINRNGQLFCL